MEVQVVSKKENPLLQRVEVRFKVVHKAEPSPPRDALRSELAKTLKATKDIVIVDGAASTFGRYETHGYAKVYKTKERALSVERKHILVRNGLIEAAVKPAEGAPAAKREKPAPPPKKEEVKVEAKPPAKPEKAPPKAEKPPAKEEKKPEAKEPAKAEKPEAKKAPPKKKEAK